jgi:hypothetical protein
VSCEPDVGEDEEGHEAEKQVNSMRTAGKRNYRRAIAPRDVPSCVSLPRQTMKRLQAFRSKDASVRR